MVNHRFGGCLPGLQSSINTVRLTALKHGDYRFTCALKTAVFDERVAKGHFGMVVALEPVCRFGVYYSTAPIDD
ncbi:hypothetical protein EG68_05294 [Paragonimus skrjabini miyazakii]|uniref:Uncharacterized protein n=1 Tax=Paragonimus skrjabini miyazakii TaxID=59628 RepID=A0A8S9YYW7_9TREM|nr:hypothetical protein EG68_05294 [Paragonimus skrjabini miyazakii]